MHVPTSVRKKPEARALPPHSKQVLFLEGGVTNLQGELRAGNLCF